MTAALPEQAQAVLDFWFLPDGALGHDRPRLEWFRKDPAFDEAIRERFAQLVDAVLEGNQPDWGDGADAALARILLLDQFPRNLFRDQARAFAGDDAALSLAKKLVASGRDKNLPPVRRWFVYLPFMHSESVIEQERSVALFEALRRETKESAFESALSFALRHRDIIERFGRFPHRNAALGRETTSEEAEFLRQPGSSF
ncbi:MAG: DUF924 family protein [Ignavibacteria bacterium]